MIKKEKNNSVYDNSSHVTSSQVMSSQKPQRPSLFRTLEDVKRQVEYEHFAETMPNGSRRIDEMYKEICLIIAEVYIKPPESIMRIRGAEIEAGIVQEVYRELGNDHLKLVVDNFKEQTHYIRQKTPYLQTALYNAVFEIESHYTNLVRHDMYGS